MLPGGGDFPAAEAVREDRQTGDRLAWSVIRLATRPLLPLSQFSRWVRSGAGRRLHRVFSPLQARKGLSCKQPGYQAVLLYEELIIREPFGIGRHANALRFGIVDLAGAGED